jgi:hypothetical protein
MLLGRRLRRFLPANIELPVNRVARGLQLSNLLRVLAHQRIRRPHDLSRLLGQAPR